MNNLLKTRVAETFFWYHAVMCANRRGVALAYVLVMLLCVSGFVTAALVRYNQTARFP